jgi:hypothetical protein
MTATVTESMPERPVKVFPDSSIGRGIPEHFVEAKVGFWRSLARVAMVSLLSPPKALKIETTTSPESFDMIHRVNELKVDL